MNGGYGFKIEKHHSILLLILFIILGNLIFLYPKLNYSPVPTKWGSGSGWGRYYIINYNKLPEKSYALTWQSDIKNYATVDVLPKILASMINIITGTTDFPDSEKFHYIFSWVGILFLPLTILYFYEYLYKKEGQFNSTDCCLLFLFTMFPLASTSLPLSRGLTAANSVSKVFFLLLIILLLVIFDERKKNKRRLSLFMFLLFPFFYYHHTWSYYFALYLTGIAVFTLLSKGERYMISLVIFGIIAFLTSAVYYNYMLLQEPANLVKAFPQILANFPSVSFTAKINPDLFGYKSLGSIYSYMQLVNSILILFICLLFFWIYMTHKKREEPKLYEKMLFYYLIAQSSVMCALFVWDGLLGVYTRFFESLTYISMLLATYLLVKTEAKLKTAIRLVLLCAVVISVVSYLSYPAELNRSLSHEEFTGIKFAGKHIPKRSYIFSDFRLATPLIYFDQSAITTINSLNWPMKITEELLDRCYYNVSNPEIILDEVIPYSTYYVIISSRQSKVFISDPSLNNFEPASADFQQKWTNQSNFNEIYSSEYIELFLRKNYQRHLETKFP